MVTKDSINYDLEWVNTSDISDLQKSYKDYVIIWVDNSGQSPCKSESSYRYVVEYKGTSCHSSGNVTGTSDSKAFAYGFRRALDHLNKRARICVVVPEALGLGTAFSGKSENLEIMQESFEIIRRHRSSLLEVRWLNCSNEIEDYVGSFF